MIHEEVSLPEMLDARERRAYRQQTLLEQYHSTLLCFTLNIAGPVKNSELIRQGYELGKIFLKETFFSRKITPLHFEEVTEKTGNEAFFVFREDAELIKKLTNRLEDSSPIGRLFDLDVLDASGRKLDRTEFGLPARACLICGKPAKDCARSRTHTVSELQEKTARILKEALRQEVPRRVGELAERALLYEVCTTPKPGLVDRFNSGSHRDMDLFTFVNSSCALRTYFEKCAEIGWEDTNPEQSEGLSLAVPSEENPSETNSSVTFEKLRTAGIEAEEAMLRATGGVNTHKGAIFTMGILAGALGRLPVYEWCTPSLILEEGASMVKGIVARDFADLTEENCKTAGQRLYLEHGITGIRGQMEKGLPAVINAGYPAFQKALSEGRSLNDAGCIALLYLMCSATDTNLIARSSLSVWEETVKEVQSILDRNPLPKLSEIVLLDEKLIQKNLSPGGSADLLAVCFLLHFLESEVYHG